MSPMLCPTLSRAERADKAKTEISQHFSARQQSFLEFVLAQYIKVGVEVLFCMEADMFYLHF